MTPTIPALADRPLGSAPLFTTPAVVAGVAEVDRCHLLMLDAVDRLAAAQAAGDGAEVAHGTTSVRVTAGGFELAVTRLCNVLRTYAAREVRAAAATDCRGTDAPNAKGGRP